MEKIPNTPPSVGSSPLLYPSQQEGFIPLDFSSPVQRQNKNPQNRHHHQQTPYFNKNRQNQNRNNYFQNNRNKNDYQQNNFRHNDDNGKYGRFSDQGNNSRGFYQQNNRKNFHNNRGRNSGAYGNQNLDIDISQYFHSSMVEDPWEELLERHNAMKGDDSNEDLLDLEESKKEKSKDNSSSSSADE